MNTTPTGKSSTARDGRIIWRLAPFGAFGAVLPAVAALGTRTDGFSFSPEPRVLFGQVIYIGSAALLSAIFPYGRQGTPFKASLVGMCFPTVVGTALGTTRAALPTLANARGDAVDGYAIVEWILDAFSLF